MKEYFNLLTDAYREIVHYIREHVSAIGIFLIVIGALAFAVITSPIWIWLMCRQMKLMNK